MNSKFLCIFALLAAVAVSTIALTATSTDEKNNKAGVNKVEEAMQPHRVIPQAEPKAVGDSGVAAATVTKSGETRAKRVLSIKKKKC